MNLCRNANRLCCAMWRHIQELAMASISGSCKYVSGGWLENLNFSNVFWGEGNHVFVFNQKRYGWNSVYKTPAGILVVHLL